MMERPSGYGNSFYIYHPRTSNINDWHTENNDQKNIFLGTLFHTFSIGKCTTEGLLCAVNKLTLLTVVVVYWLDSLHFRLYSQSPTLRLLLA